MSDQESGYLLKILSGNHQGAEVLFHDETAIVGSDLNSDVVLSDSLIEPQHISLKFSKDGIILQPLNGKVFLDGQLVKEESVTVETFQFITIGSTHLIIGPSNQTWPSITAMDAPQLVESNNEKIEEVLEEKIEDVIPPESQSMATKGRKKTFIYAGAGIAIFTFAAVLLLCMSIFSDTKPVVAKPDTMVLLQGAVRELGLSGNVAIAKTQRGYMATGYTLSNESLSTLKTKLAAIDPNIKNKVYSEEKILSEINTLLSTIESRPKVQTVSNGVFLLTGYAFDKDQWGKVRRRILEDIIGINDLQDEVILPQKAYNLVRPILSKYKLTGKIGIVPQADGIVVGGLVSSDEEENWRLAKIQIEKTLGNDVLLKNYVKISDPDVIKQQYFGSEVNSVSISDNGMNWIGFKDGTKYMVGATLANGYTIKEITPENIVLSKENQTIVLKIGELK